MPRTIQDPILKLCSVHFAVAVQRDRCADGLCLSCSLLIDHHQPPVTTLAIIVIIFLAVIIIIMVLIITIFIIVNGDEEEEKVTSAKYSEGYLFISRQNFNQRNKKIDIDRDYFACMLCVFTNSTDKYVDFFFIHHYQISAKYERRLQQNDLLQS